MEKGRNRKRTVRLLVAGACAVVCAGSGWWLARAADELDLREARGVLQRLFGADLKRDQVRIRKISPAPFGSSVIVEAQIETAFRFERDGENWKVAEMRLGDRQWESIDLVTEAVRREKLRRTAVLLSRMAESLNNYRQANGGYVATEEIGRLLDELFPRYLNPLIRFDLWGTPLSYQGSATSYRLVSAGPDRQAGTPDDLVIENGVIKTPTE